MLDTLSLLNINDTCHLEHLAWAVYDGALLVCRQPELPGNHQWCTMLVGLYKHIYWGHVDAAHCSLYTLASWDCQERTKALHQEGKLGSVWSGHKRASRSRRRSRSRSRHHSRMPALRDWSGHSCCSLPNMPQRCHCGEPLSPGANTMPKLPLAVNIPAHTQSSCSGGEMARASLDDDEAWLPDPTHARVLHSKMGWGWLWGTGHGENEGFQGKSHLAVIFPGGHW